MKLINKLLIILVSLCYSFECGTQSMTDEEGNKYSSMLSALKRDFFPNLVARAAYRFEGTMKNTNKFIVPEDHLFFLGDNRDCSKDSRFLSSVGYVNINNLVGKAQIIFLSNDKNIGSLLNFWKWGDSIRVERFFNKIK